MAKKKIQFNADDVDRFVRLLIPTLFHDNIKDDTSPEDRAHVYDEIRSLCLARGVVAFLEDFSENDFVDTMVNYSANSLQFIQSVAANLHEHAEEDKMSHAEQELFDFLVHEKGVDPVRSPAEELLRKMKKRGNPLAALMQALGGKAVLVTRTTEEGKCGCPGCRANREGRYFVKCPVHKRVPLTDEEYTEQLLDPDTGFFCPECKTKCELDEDGEE